MRDKSPTCANLEADMDYVRLERQIAERVAAVTEDPLFTTDASGLFDLYLACFAPEVRQHYNCHACRRFIDRFGVLVRLSPTGEAMPALWADLPVPALFRPSVRLLDATVRRATVTGAFYSPESLWGIPRTGTWSHLSGRNSKPFKHPTQSAWQAAAAKKEDFAMLGRALAEYSGEAVAQAVRILDAEVLDRQEKALGHGRWLHELHLRLRNLHGERRNMLWYAVAMAPPGWCHVKSSMIGTLLEDICHGYDLDTIKRRWNEKMHPLQYQRPTTLKQGHIARANALVEKLGSEGALQRRFARRSDVLANHWLPAPAAAEMPRSAANTGPFSHLKPAQAAVHKVLLPTRRISWHKFFVEVLPQAREIHCRMPQSRGHFFGLVTAANPSAPPILQWDDLPGCARNPTSWYFYHGGSLAEQWCLHANSWVPVTAICAKPCHWQAPQLFRHQGEGIFLLLDGAKDSGYRQGAGFFPEMLRSEYHGSRAALEAYAQAAVIADWEQGDANGICLAPNAPLTIKVRTGDAFTQEYHLVLE